MNDHLIRALIQDADLRALAVVSSRTCREAAERHQCAPTSGLVLSEALTSGLLLARLHKAPRRVNLQIETDGPIRGLVVDADADGRVRGFPRVSGLDFVGAHGARTEPAFGTQGMVNVLREMKPGEWYQGLVPLEGRSVARGVEDYLRASEQVESALQVAAHLGPDGLPDVVVGLLFQRLPGGSRAAIEAVRARLADGWLHEAVDAAAAAGEVPAAGALLDAFMEAKGGENLQLFDRTDVGFHCGCSLERVEQALLTLGPGELQAMIDEDGGADVNCDFCNAGYQLDRPRLEHLRSITLGLQA